MTNLIDILAVARGVTPAAVEQEMRSARGYGDLKAATAQAVVEMLAPLQEGYAELRGDEERLEAILAEGAREGPRDGARDAGRRTRGHGRRAPAAERSVRRLALLVGAIVLVDTMFYAAITPLLPSWPTSSGSARTAPACWPAPTRPGRCSAPCPAAGWRRAPA